MKKTIMAAALFASLTGAGVAQAQDAEAGKAVFTVCKACHQVGEGGKNAVGPVLNGVIGRKSGSLADFNYSEAMKNSNLVWDEANFAEYIANPKGKIAGNKMVYAGQKDPQKVKDLYAFLKQYDAEGKVKAP
jgi:cytochrome c